MVGVGHGGVTSISSRDERSASADRGGTKLVGVEVCTIWEFWLVAGTVTGGAK